MTLQSAVLEAQVPVPGSGETMKMSMFNSFIPYRGKVLGFNAFTENYLLMEQSLWRELDAARKSGTFEGLAATMPDMVRGLLDNGFLVQTGRDELAEVKAISQAVDNDDRLYHIILNPTMSCNFSCWYCYETHEKSSRVSSGNLERILRHVSKVCETRPGLKALHLAWFGGEPLMQYEGTVVPVSEHCRRITDARGIHFSSSFTTNGYLIKNSMLEGFRQANTVNFQITLDGHRAHHDQVRYVGGKRRDGDLIGRHGSYDRIVANIAKLVTNDFGVTLRINYTKDNIGDVEAIVDDLQAAGLGGSRFLTVALHRVWQADDVDAAVINRTMQLLQDRGFSSNTLFTHGKAITDPCYADKRSHVTINYNGDVFKCTARDFKSKDREGVLGADGEIDWGDNLESRMSLKFKNRPCLDCRILPLCNGGCTQVMKENIGRDYCVYHGDEREKDAVVIARFEHLQNFKPKLKVDPDTELSEALLE